MDEEKTILIVDDHPIIVLAVRSLVESKLPGYKVLGVSSRAEALAALESEKPRMAIIDLVLADGNGLELIGEIHGKVPSCSVLVYSMQCELRFGPRALRAGAQGYLMKGEKVSVLFDAFRHLEDGKVFCSDALREALVQRWSGSDRESGIGGELSARESQIFQLFGHGSTSKEIGTDLCISPKTVESHRENIKRKLGCRTSTELVLKARDWLNNDGGGVKQETRTKKDRRPG